MERPHPKGWLPAWPQRGHWMPSVQNTSKQLGKALLNAPERTNSLQQPTELLLPIFSSRENTGLCSFLHLAQLYSKLQRTCAPQISGVIFNESVFCCRGRAMLFPSSSGRPRTAGAFTPPHLQLLPSPARGSVRFCRCYFGLVFLL